MRSHKTIPATPPSVVAQISQLPELEMPAIKSLWQKIFHGDVPNHNRQFLERRIAYKLQEIEYRILLDALPDHLTLFDLAVDPAALWDEQRVRIVSTLRSR